MNPRPPHHPLSGERIERLAVFIPAIALCIGLIAWAITSANMAAQTAANLAVTRAEIMARFDRIDMKLESVPAMTVRLTDLERRADRLEAKR